MNTKVRTSFHRPLFSLTAGVVFGLAWSGRAQVPEQLLKSFGNVSQSGGRPVCVVVGADGALYGVTSMGGVYGQGTVFRVNADGSAYTVLRAFGAATNDAVMPTALLQSPDGELYGAASGGGSNNSGVIFKLSTDGSVYTNLYTFGNFYGDASAPAGLIQGVDSQLYGVAAYGGTNLAGAAFKLGTNGSAYQVLYNFGDELISTSNSYYYADGATPLSLSQGQDGGLYGVTSDGGTNSAGVVFRLSTNGSTYAALYSFGAFTNDASLPVGVAQRADGVLFGVGESGGTNNLGAIFKLNTNGLGYGLVYSFTGTDGDGANPGAGLIRGQDGSWYGTTLHGGSQQDDGTVFRLNADGTGYQVIRRFTVITSILYDTFSTDGQEPAQLAQSADGLLYGVTAYGGTTGQGAYSETGAGTLFVLATNATGYAVVFNFSTNGGDAQFPAAGVVVGPNGALYGTSEFGGPAGQGSVFKINSDGSGYQFLYGFGLDPIDGLNPESGLSAGRDGALYGTTSVGGYSGGSGAGTLFKINSDGSGYTELHSFGFLNADGETPTAPPVLGSDGNLYGTTSEGGYQTPWGGFGIVYKLGTNGLGYMILHEFSTNNLEGRSPQGGLIQGPDGALYGTTLGGPHSDGFGLSYGTVFRILTNGNNLQTLHAFTNNGVDGQSPYASLILGADGLLYGTTRYGGSNNFGTVFKLNTSGTNYQVLYNFGTATNDGHGPTGPLTQGSDGYLYGTTIQGGAFGLVGGFGYGIAFKVNTNGTSYTVMHNFGSTSGDGQGPLGGLVQGLDGGFYGTTSAGGVMNAGTVFRLGPAPFEFTAFSLMADKTVYLSLVGSSNTTCRIDSSTNLKDWVELTTLNDTNGSVEFFDTNASKFPRRYYRAFQGP